MFQVLDHGDWPSFKKCGLVFWRGNEPCFKYWIMGIGLVSKSALSQHEASTRHNAVEPPVPNYYLFRHLLEGKHFGIAKDISVSE